MRFAIALLLVLHGFAHAVGFAGAWQLSPKVPFKTTVFAGHVDVGVSGIRILGIVWLALAAAFVVAGVAAFARAAWWPPLAIAVTIVSLAMCIVELPDAKVGVAVNLALLAAFSVAPRAGGVL